METIGYSENDLNFNLNEIAHEAVREIYISAKKISVYSAAHPLAQKTVGRPFLIFDRLARYKKYFNLHISGGRLFALNIRVRPSIFSEQLMDFMQRLDIKDIIFDCRLTTQELTLFLDRLVKKVSGADYQSVMINFLAKNKIENIQVNGEIGAILFEKGLKFQGDLPGDYSLRAVVSAYFGDSFDTLASMLLDEELPVEQYLMKFHHDFLPALVRHLIPEKVSLMEPGELCGAIAEKVLHLGENPADPSTLEIPFDRARALISLLNFHPDREEILTGLKDELTRKGVPVDIYAEIIPLTGAIKVESQERIDQYLDATFYGESFDLNLEEFSEHFSRLLRTGQQGKAKAVVKLLVERLAGDNLDSRQKALELLTVTLATFHNPNYLFLVDHIAELLNEFLAGGKETFEFSELIWNLVKVYFSQKRYDRLSMLCSALQKRCRHQDGVTIYDSLAVKKAIMQFNNREMINQLVWEIVDGSQAGFGDIKNILVTFGSEEVAFALSTIVSHESRQVRQNALKILSELGKASLNVFSRIIEDNANFERDEGRHELPDARWYLVRNSIFVLGALKDQEGCKALRVRINDPDTRVRRAIVAALEKIGGEQALDLLMVMANDSDREISEAAIIAIGLIGTPEIVPELIDLANNRHPDVVRIITTLGMLGGEEARKFLAHLLSDTELQSQLTSNRTSRDELRLAILKALGKIGDKESLEKIREFNDTLSASQKIFFGASKLNRAAQDILSKKER